MGDGREPDGSRVRIDVRDPDEPAARACLEAYYAELGERFDDGFDGVAAGVASDAEMRLPTGIFLVVTLDGRPIGCGGVKLPAGGPAYIKRMWVSRSARGLGVGRRLLTELERRAVEHGASSVELETNRNLVEAIAMYRSAGYLEVPAFNDEPHAHHWFEKRIPSGR